MKNLILRLLRWTSLLSILAGGVLHAEEAPNAAPIRVLEQAGALLGEMKEWGQEFADARWRRGMTPAKLDALAQSTARRLARNRERLAALLPALPPDTEIAQRLERFLVKWPDEAAFLGDLTSTSADRGQSQSDIVSLWMRFPDKRQGWKTPFPFMRP